MTATFGAVGTQQNRRAALNPLARLGLSARAFIYLVIGLLAVLVAAGKSRAETDQSGALQAVNRDALGHVVIWVLAIGFASYAIWRFSEVVFGAAGEGRKAGPRVQSLARGLVYSFLAANAFQVALSDRTSSQSGRQVTVTADAMTHPAGRVVVGIVGAVIVVVGAVLAYQGVTKKFEKYLDTAGMSPRTHKVVRVLGMVGTTARGIVFALSGVFVIVAAVRYQPSQAGGLDHALRSLRDTPVGPSLLGLVALGLVAFGIYGFAEARWRRT